MITKERSSTICWMALVAILLAKPAIAAWDPARYEGENTLQFLTVGPDEGEHWSTVWLVVIDDQVYIRLGSRAATRIQGNTRAPIVSIRVGGEEFADVEAMDAREMTEKVAAAMAEKYWSDVLVRYFSHPLTIKLRPKQAP